MDAKCAKRSPKTWTTNFYKSSFKNIFLYMNSRLSKIRSVHKYAMPRTVYFGWICIYRKQLGCFNLIDIKWWWNTQDLAHSMPLKHKRETDMTFDLGIFYVEFFMKIIFIEGLQTNFHWLSLIIFFMKQYWNSNTIEIVYLKHFFFMQRLRIGNIIYNNYSHMWEKGHFFVH